jgi:hypothetical protein
LHENYGKTGKNYNFKVIYEIEKLSQAPNGYKA